MSKTVTLRLDETVYQRFRAMAERDNRPRSNFIETAVLRYLEREEFVDKYKMEEIQGIRSLNVNRPGYSGDFVS